MTSKSITELSTKDAPAPAPMPVFSRAIKANGMAQTFKNIVAILEAAGSDFTQIVKLNVYLKSYDDFGPMNGVYITHFGDPKPART
ncbi:hypothetical protein BP5796_04638 [Coleophoma crateriformis]|uniref:Uncharacterized protein n=1 Tax=Coleophoma crateriformis TaxID=565419 RepID=A0A3D8S9W6_9HELO|nr:hypothetical protein BP5796_04638 [Coleophoma crateriformis]